MSVTIPESVIAWSILALVVGVGLGITWRKLRHKRTTRSQVFGFVGFIAVGAACIAFVSDVPYPVFGTSQGAGQAEKWITVVLASFAAFGLVYWLLKPAGKGKRGLRLLKVKPLRTMSSKELEAEKAKRQGDLQATQPLDDQADLGSRLAPTASPAPAAEPTAIRTLTEDEQMTYFRQQLEENGLLDDTAKRAANHARYETDPKYRAYVDREIAAKRGDPRDDV